MHDAIDNMLKRYNCQTASDHQNALKEIIQELALFALWRHKFFEHAAFYGGTALRILYGLNRFSEDLDFSLLKHDSTFKLQKYEASISKELQAFGFELSIEVKKKSIQTPIQSAFLKGNTMIHLLKIGMPKEYLSNFHQDELVKIKLEVDTHPPPRFQTEVVPIFYPLPFSIKTYTLPNLFAGKISALLYRNWKNRVKGRDWYDFLWFVGKDIPLNVDHLAARIFEVNPSIQQVTFKDVQALIHLKIDTLNLKQAKEDLFPFIADSRYLEGWTHDLFHSAVNKMRSTI